MKIDIHAHQFPDSFIQAYKPLVKQGVVPGVDLEFRPWILEEHLALLDETGIDKQVLSLVLTAYPSDREALRDLVQTGNDSFAEVSRKHPDRFAALAALPLTSIEDALKELKRAIEELGMKGVILGTNVRGEALDDEKYFPLFEELNRLKCPVLLHPIDPMGPERYGAYNLDLWVSWPAETTIAVSRLILNGVLDRYPDLRLVLSHLGGSTHYMIERIGEAARMAKINRPAIEYFKDIYYDTAGPVPSSAVLCACNLFGSERIVLGSDYPLGPEEGKEFIQKAINCVEDLSLPEKDMTAIFEGNAQNLLGL